MDPKLFAEIEGLRREFVVTLLTRKSQIHLSFLGERVQPLCHHVHKLAGTAGSFGFRELSNLARDLEVHICDGVGLDELETNVQEVLERIDAICLEYGVSI